jgi:hypothetical protein
MPKSDPERVRKLLAELREGDSQEQKKYKELVLAGLKDTYVIANEGDRALSDWAIRKGLKADLSQDRVSTVDQKIIQNLSSTWTRDEPTLMETFRNAYRDATEKIAGLGVTDETIVTRLANRLSFYESGVPTRMKSELEKAKELLRATNIPANQVLSLYRAHYLDRTDTIDPTKGPDFTNPVADHGTIPVGRTQGHTGPISPQEEREKLTPVQPPAPIPTSGDTVPRDRPPLGLSERTLIEQDLQRLVASLPMDDLRNLHTNTKARLGYQRSTGQ